MLKITDIKELIRTLDKSSVDELKIEQEGMKLSLKKGSTQPQVITVAREDAPKMVAETISTAPTLSHVEEQKKETSEAPAPKEELKGTEVTTNSPMVGTFYIAPAPDADPYVKVGDKVKEDTIVCIVEAMKLMNEIEAEVNGKIIEVLANNGELVEYGQPLFIVQPK